MVELHKKNKEVAVIPDTWMKSHDQCAWPDYKTRQRSTNFLTGH